MTQITSFRDLIVWQQAMDLAVRCFGIARSLPRGHDPVLGHQLRKSALSIPSNIAEGFSRGSTAFYLQHLRIAHASVAELETQLEIAGRLGMVGAAAVDILIADTREIGRMLNGLSNALERSARSKAVT